MHNFPDKPQSPHGLRVDEKELNLAAMSKNVY